MSAKGEPPPHTGEIEFWKARSWHTWIMMAAFRRQMPPNKQLLTVPLSLASHSLLTLGPVKGQQHMRVSLDPSPRCRLYDGLGDLHGSPPATGARRQHWTRPGASNKPGLEVWGLERPLSDKIGFFFLLKKRRQFQRHGLRNKTAF